MITIIPISEKNDKKKRTITITKNIRLNHQEFELLKMLANNKYVHISDMIMRLYGRKTLDKRTYIMTKLSKLRGYGFTIERYHDRYKCTDEIYVR